MVKKYLKKIIAQSQQDLQVISACCEGGKIKSNEIKYLPNNKIGIMHLAAGIWKEGKDMRLDKSIKIEIKSLNDNTVSKSLRFEKS